MGFLCSAGGGVPQRVYDALDPNMPEPSKKLLGKVCAGQRSLIPGVIDLATLTIASAPLPATGTEPTPKRARPARGSLCTLAEPCVASPVAAGLLAPTLGQAACPVPDSLATRDARRMNDAVDHALVLFKTYAANTERYKATYGSSDFTNAKLLVLRRCLQAKTRSAPALRTKTLDARRFLKWCRTQGYDPIALTEWEVAAWVGEKARATKTGGLGALSALRWLEAAFGVCMHATSTLVRTQADSMHCAPRPRPMPARCPSEHQVCLWENLLADANTSLVARCYAGIFCALTHGMLRWSDLQRTSELELTQDAITGLACMKNQKFITRWAAPRYGFTNTDWGQQWHTSLMQAGLPGLDFIIWGADKHLTTFKNTIAEFACAQRAMRSLLQRRPFEYNDETAKSYTLHGFRHIYTTSMRQLNFPDDVIDDAGHWKRGSGMPRVYDAAEATTELVAKNKVRCAIASGWRRAKPGCLPPPAPFSPSAPATPGPVVLGAPSTPGAHLPIASCPSPVARSTTQASSSCSSGGLFSHVVARAAPRSPSPLARVHAPVVRKPVPLKIINYQTKILHKWMPKSNNVTEEYTMCRRMKCGTPLVPAANAQFELGYGLDEKHFDLCRACFGK